jgi:aspartate-semialdehyde dehydrogenase
MKIAVVGATGLVGTEMLKVLANSAFNNSDVIAAASEHSAGKKLPYQNRDLEVVSIKKCMELRPDFALFSAGASVSKEWAPLFAEAGISVIDNSSAWRMDSGIKLIVPEVNGHLLDGKEGIVANPNCSTIQMVVVLMPLHKAFRLRRVVVSTYQSVTGSGVKGICQLHSERSGQQCESPAYPHQIDMNLIPHIDQFMENGYTKEEMKMIGETRKIMDLAFLPITATTVRVPVLGGHSESVNLEFEQPAGPDAAREILRSSPGVIIMDNPSSNEYPMPLHSHNRDEVFVGRIRKDESVEFGLNLWITADNLRKGAATNAVQIAEKMAEQRGLF